MVKDADPHPVEYGHFAALFAGPHVLVAAVFFQEVGGQESRLPFLAVEEDQVLAKGTRQQLSISIDAIRQR